jgi:hypothetical protein
MVVVLVMAVVAVMTMVVMVAMAVVAVVTMVVVGVMMVVVAMKMVTVVSSINGGTTLQGDLCAPS